MAKKYFKRFKRKITKKYLNTLCDKIAYFFYTYGTLRAASLDYVAMALDVENDDFLTYQDEDSICTNSDNHEDDVQEHSIFPLEEDF